MAQSTDPSPGRIGNRVLDGCLLVFGLNVTAVLLLAVIGGISAAMNVTLAARVMFALVALMGVVQLSYLVPIGRRLRARGQSHALQGVIIGAALTFLLTAACAGPVLSNLFVD